MIRRAVEVAFWVAMLPACVAALLIAEKRTRHLR
jgi:hypothetical protein